MANSKAPGSANAYRRQKQIEDSLYANLLMRPYTSVSVSDLCLQLEISRKSFYNYFPDKDSCFRSLIRRKLRQCSLTIASGARESENADDVIAVFLNFWRQERGFLDVIVRNNLLTMLFDQCIRFLREEDRVILDLLKTPQLETDDFVLACFVNVHITIVLQWHKGGFEIPVEEMIPKYKRLFYEPLLSL